MGNSDGFSNNPIDAKKFHGEDGLCDIFEHLSKEEVNNCLTTTDLAASRIIYFVNK